MAQSDPARQPGAGPWHARQGIQRVLQFTDLHLYADPDQTLFGVPTRSTFEAVLAQSQVRHWPPDVILFTGDLVHDERLEGYRYLRQVIDRCGIPCFCIPGNHDHKGLLAKAVDALAAEPFRAERIGSWDLLLLDSTIDGSDAGRLQPGTLEAVEQHLASNQGRPTLISLHHQPVPVGSRWIDTMKVEDGAALLGLTARYPQLRLILWGHVHQSFDRRQGSTRLLATPSTCAQFAPGHEEFTLDDEPPGYRWLELHADGRLNTGIERVEVIPQAVEKPLLC
ncbi:3',5'-cyclic-AMP phosphodiesterase [Halochromatium glycolicum]|uniref:3',5'-cyclic-AMP phosphodiesterase n=1 Tax=Halochromatium glycolicum TaxID=85075 RepID=A0AAJ0U292_9GAMM|nr:3',5'-cyclic-AMP phosphodiesterase [Halochromatium glycolicum]MBK1703959.1 3',5'-cyclic-AMP phosphodiesterase [Halochromatium glycolicum]